jgi:hypothetical protein
MADTALNSTMIIAPLLAGFLYQTQPDLVYPVALGFLFLVLLASFFFAPHEESPDAQMEQT